MPLKNQASIMQSKRQNKVSRLIQKELANLFQAAQMGSKNAFITVTLVRISPDLAQAKVYLSIFPIGEGGEQNNDSELKNRILEEIIAKGGAVRKRLGDLVRNQLRIVPALEFYIDDSLDYEDHISDLLKE
ncbi:30S ribosome-binding factor RbfA [Flavobacteriales bacterium AH-315-E23]|nr:30S ribosome-binding factor RbfA [Flavobacteriales bacterium AH-315-E23]